MRHRGISGEHKPAERLVHCLTAQPIEAEGRPAQDTGEAVWVLEEARVVAARLWQRFWPGQTTSGLLSPRCTNGATRPRIAGV
jgi:hypothetical protein